MRRRSLSRVDPRIGNDQMWGNHLGTNESLSMEHTPSLFATWLKGVDAAGLRMRPVLRRRCTCDHTLLCCRPSCQESDLEGTIGTVVLKVNWLSQLVV